MSKNSVFQRYTTRPSAAKDSLQSHLIPIPQCGRSSTSSSSHKFVVLPNYCCCVAENVFKMKIYISNFIMINLCNFVCFIICFTDFVSKTSISTHTHTHTVPVLAWWHVAAVVGAQKSNKNTHSYADKRVRTLNLQSVGGRTSSFLRRRGRHTYVRCTLIWGCKTFIALENFQFIHNHNCEFVYY